MFRSDIAFAITVEDKNQRAQIWSELTEIIKREVTKPNVYGVVLTANDEEAFVADASQAENRTDVGVFYPSKDNALAVVVDILTKSKAHGIINGDPSQLHWVANTILQALRD